MKGIVATGLCRRTLSVFLAAALVTAACFTAGCRSTIPSAAAAAAPVVAPPAQKLVFVYLHGIGGVKEKPRFCANLREFLEDVPYDCAVRNYEWDSVEIVPLKAGSNWLEAGRRADAEAERLKRTVIDELEKDRTPYVLVGFSLGSRVILRSLEQSRGNLRMLRGVYFLGSAMTRDTAIGSSCLPPGMKITNYHSPLRDKVHRMAFSFMESIPAGGRVGFDNTDVFDNYPVSCTHAFKGVGAHIDYSQLARAIGYIALYRERVCVPGETSYNIAFPVGDGDVWWNKILRLACKVEGRSCVLEIQQQNMKDDYFRAVAIYADGTRRRVARGNNIHAILDELGVLPAAYWRNGERRRSRRNGVSLKSPEATEARGPPAKTVDFDGNAGGSTASATSSLCGLDLGNASSRPLRWAR
jgi:hypothetical protein